MKKMYIGLRNRIHSFCLFIYGFFVGNLLWKKGNNVHFNGKLTLVNPRNIQVGNNCSFNHGDYINAFNPIHIGDDVTVSANVNIVSTGIDYESWFENGKKSHLVGQDISIGNHVWIGCGASILGGVHITGEYVVIAAGAVVNKDIADSYCIVAGCPAKVIKRGNCKTQKA